MEVADAAAAAVDAPIVTASLLPMTMLMILMTVMTMLLLMQCC